MWIIMRHPRLERQPSLVLVCTPHTTVGRCGHQRKGQCGHVCGNIKLITQNSEKGKREKEKKKGFITDLVGGLFLNVK